MTSTGAPEPKLRAFRAGDLARVQALVYRTIGECYTGVYPPAAVAFFKDYHSRTNILADAKAGRTFVLELGNRVVGVGALLGTTIKRVFVDPSFQHRGYGRLLMARLEEEARRRGVTTVDLDASLTSKRLYDFLGYKGRRRARIDVGSGQSLDYFPMRKRLGAVEKGRSPKSAGRTRNGRQKTGTRR